MTNNEIKKKAYEAVKDELSRHISDMWEVLESDGDNSDDMPLLLEIKGKWEMLRLLLSIIDHETV